MKNIKIKKTVYIVFVIVGLFIVQTFASKLGGFIDMEYKIKEERLTSNEYIGFLKHTDLR